MTSNTNTCVQKTRLACIAFIPSLESFDLLFENQRPVAENSSFGTQLLNPPLQLSPSIPGKPQSLADCYTGQAARAQCTFIDTCIRICRHLFFSHNRPFHFLNSSGLCCDRIDVNTNSSTYCPPKMSFNLCLFGSA